MECLWEEFLWVDSAKLVWQISKVRSMHANVSLCDT